MTLKDSIQTDGLNVFLNADEFADSITYKFRNGGSRSIKAIIDRSPPAVYDAAGDVVLPEYIISIHLDAVTGVLASEVNTGGDTVSIVADLDDTSAETKTVMVIVSQDEGMIELALK